MMGMQGLELCHCDFGVSIGQSFCFYFDIDQNLPTPKLFLLDPDRASARPRASDAATPAAVSRHSHPPQHTHT
jgi:hypothetical protein